jgi:multicomponent Na+:H+ antiporter subunit B
MLKRLLTLALMIALAAVFFPLMQGIKDRSNVDALSREYLRNGAEDLGAPNLVTSVVVTYRGLDTLGEVTVLFAAAAGISLVFQFIRRDKGDNPAGNGTEGDLPSRIEASEILKTASGILLPMILLFGVYIFVHGHLTPGGGFQGGVVIASAILMAFLAGTIGEASHGLITVLETVAGAGYVAVGLLGLWLAAGFLDPRFLPFGEFGQLFSAGAIPVIYSLIGIKVGSELSGVIDVMRRKA